MNYKYWYVDVKDEGPVRLDRVKTDEEELGPLPFSTDQALRKIQRLAGEKGRRVLRVQRWKAY